MEYKTVSEFRKKMKEAFDNAQKVGTVHIKRGNETFLLVSESRVKAVRDAHKEYKQEYRAEQHVVNEGWGA